MVRKWIVIAAGFAVAVMFSTGATADDDEVFQYVGFKKCRTCHKKELIGNQYGVWKDSRHAGAFKTLASDKALEYAKKRGIEGPPQETPECLKCHVTGYGEDPSKFGAKPLSARDGIQCEACHGAGSGYKTKKTMSNRKKAVSKGLVIPDEEVCLRCHKDESPAWDPAKYLLADGSRVGFDFEQAMKEIEHPIPEDVKGHYIEREKEAKAKKKAQARAEKEGHHDDHDDDDDD